MPTVACWDETQSLVCVTSSSVPGVLASSMDGKPCLSASTAHESALKLSAIYTRVEMAMCIYLNWRMAHFSRMSSSPSQRRSGDRGTSLPSSTCKVKMGRLVGSAISSHIKMAPRASLMRRNLTSADSNSPCASRDLPFCRTYSPISRTSARHVLPVLSERSFVVISDPTHVLGGLSSH